LEGRSRRGSGGGGPGDGKAAAYREIEAQLRSLLEDCPDPVARMATAAALLMGGLEHASWVGFYLRQDDGSLLVGPYQGPLACMLLPPGKGVCGAAASSGRTVVVADVHAYPGHIACDPSSRSEIVVPLVREGRVFGVLDLDSDRPAAFDEVDRVHLEVLARIIAR
jgi:GAF domain-containing protein